MADYDLSFQSNRNGVLANRIDTKTWSVDVEVGRSIKLNNSLVLVPRIRVVKTSVTVADFTDNLGSQVSMPKTSRRAVSFGLLAQIEPTTPQKEGAIGWHASLDYEKNSDDEGTLVQVSDENLISKSRNKRFIVGLGGNWRKDNLFINGEIRAAIPSSANVLYSGHIAIGASF